MISEFFEFIGMTILVILGIMVIALLIGVPIYFLSGSNSPTNYSYIDLEDNGGYANWCSTNYKMTCYADGKTIEVKEYTKQ